MKTRTEGRDESILEARARALARTPAGDDLGPSLDLILVTLADELYGLEIGRVDEIQPLRNLAPIPGTAAYWAGIVNLRGRLIPVLDLAVLFGLVGRSEARAGSLVVVVSAPAFTAALRVDEVTEVRRVSAATILSQGPGASGASRDLIKGVTPDLITVIDLDALLADPRLTPHDASTLERG